MGRNQHKKYENTKNQNANPPERDHNSSPAREQSWMRNESDALTKTGFRRWVIRNFSELKEHVLTQCKETKNLGQRFDKMLMRINCLEKTISDLMELKNKHKNFTKHTQVSIAKLTKYKRMSEIDDEVNEIK